MVQEKKNTIIYLTNYVAREGQNRYDAEKDDELLQWARGKEENRYNPEDDEFFCWARGI